MNMLFYKDKRFNILFQIILHLILKDYESIMNLMRWIVNNYTSPRVQPLNVVSIYKKKSNKETSFLFVFGYFIDNKIIAFSSVNLQMYKRKFDL